jgi:cytochrome c5
VANAPKLGDKAAWEPRAALGMDTLLKTAITGKGAMPPKGGSAYSDEQLSSVIEYMLTKAGLTVSN